MRDPGQNGSEADALEGLVEPEEHEIEVVPTLDGFIRFAGRPEGSRELGETDDDNAFRLVQKMYGWGRFCPEWKTWLLWNSHRWIRDERNDVYECARISAREYLCEAQEEMDPERKKAMLSWGKQSLSRVHLDAAVAIARSDPRVILPVGDLDLHPTFYNGLNLTVDMETGIYRAQSSADHLTKESPVLLDSRALCPRWEKFCFEIMGDDPAFVDFLMRAVAYSISGLTSERVMFILYGEGKNGKSVFLNVLARILGDYALKIQAETFMLKFNDAACYEVADLKGARFVYASEFPEGRRLNEARVKELTGSENISARAPYEKHVRFRPEAKFWIATNSKPEIHGGQKAIWDRIWLIPFNVRFGTTEHPANPKIEDELVAEGPGILASLFRYFLDWQKIGLLAPDELLAAQGAYKAEEDVLGDFLDEECLQGSGLRETSTRLFKGYVTWAEGNELKAIGHRSFVQRMKEHGFERVKDNIWWFRGVRLKGPSGDSTPEE